MITKEKFFEILDYLQENQQFEDDLRTLLYHSSKETNFMDAAMFTDIKLTEYFLFLLEEEFNDHKNRWIRFWIYDLNFGKEWTSRTVLDKNNKMIKLQTKEDLYNLLIHNEYDSFIGTTD